MILGIGNDVCDIRRIEESLAQFEERFEERVFTAGEREKAQSRAQGGAQAIASTYAKRFAAKEACVKALNSGTHNGIGWHDMEITNAESGKATLILHNKALEQLGRLLPPKHDAVIHLTMSDEYPYAWAMVIIEAHPHAH